MNRAALVPPITNEDRLPHEKAVWRESSGMAPMGEQASLQISVEYRGAGIEQTTIASAYWPNVQRWRFGWAPAR